MSLKKEELINKIIELGIPLDENVKWDNTKLVKILGEHYMPENASFGTRFVQSMETCMLAKHLKDEAKCFKVSPLESDDYVSEFKCNGCRVIVVFDPSNGFELFSRRESVTNFLNGNFTPKVLFINNGIVTKPSDYAGKFNLRFVLDGEITVDNAEDLEFEGSHYDNVEDFLQAVLGSLPARAQAFQLAGKALKFNIFDCLYYEKNPEANAPLYNFDFSSNDELTKEEISWVESHYTQYLLSAGFTLGKRIPKLLYRYLYDLRKTPKYDIRRLPFYKRRQARKLLVNYLQQANLPFVEVQGEDKFKTAYLEEVLADKGEGCFKSDTKINMADGTVKCISQIKTGDVVLSYDIESKKIEPKEVTNVFYNGQKPATEWVSVSHGALQGKIPNRTNAFRRIICTSNHKFFDGKGYSDIKNLDYCYEYDYVLDEYRKQALLGWILSDACLDKNNLITLTQKYDSPYWKYTLEMFKDFIKAKEGKVFTSGKGSKMGRVSILKRYTFDCFKYSDSFCEMIKQMGEIALAFFIMGDGSYHNGGINISTEAYSLEEVNLIVAQINNIVQTKLNLSNPLNATLHLDKRVKKGAGYSIRYNKADTDSIFAVVGRYMHESMLYKFGERERLAFEGYPETSKGLTKAHVLSTSATNYKNYTAYSQIGAWDLEVADNHNYFVENVLVHNCILKNLDAPYISALKSSRSHKACLKVKQSVSELMENANKFEDFDVFITGANPPKSKSITDMIGSLSCSIYIKEADGEEVVHEIANISGIPHEWKRELALIGEDGSISLNPKYLDKVIAIDGMALTHTSLRFQHAVLKEKNGLVFKDKEPVSCVWDREELEKMIIVRGRK